MDSAYQKFFKEHSGYPKFKSKKNNHKSYSTNSTNNNIEVDFEKNRIKLPKLKWVKAKVHRVFVGIIKSATLSQTPSGKYFISILVNCENFQMKSTGAMVGIDLGIKDLVITSDGEKFENSKTLYKYEKKLVKEQRKLAKKTKGSNNRNKQRIKVARLYEKITNIRVDNLHKISHKLIQENQLIVSEDLKISNMVKIIILQRVFLIVVGMNLQGSYSTRFTGMVDSISRLILTFQVVRLVVYVGILIRKLRIYL